VSASSVVAPASESQETTPAQGVAASGLTSNEARARFEKDGPNAMADTSADLLRNALAKFWAPVPCLLEASVVLEIVLQKYYEAAVISALVVFNAALAYFGIEMAPLPMTIIAGELAGAIAFGAILDVVNVPVFARLRIA
jgi:H+-transporting ATPase